MKGRTFLPVSHNETSHLFVILSDPDIDKNVLAANVTTYYGTGREDESCIMHPGEHPFIKQKSYIAYHRAIEINCIKLLGDKFKQNIIFKEDISPVVLKRIQDGLKSRKGCLWNSGNTSISFKVKHYGVLNGFFSINHLERT